MVTATKYLFGNDFRATRAEPGRDAAADTAGSQQLMAERLAYERGLEDGRRAAEASAERRLLDTLERLSAQMPEALTWQDGRAQDVEERGLAFFGALARKIAGEVLARQPLGPVEELAAEAFRHLRGVPHLAVRVPPALVEDVDRLLAGMARERGYEGRLIVLGDDGMGPGDVRIEWADGGVVRDAGAVDEAVSRVLAGLPS